MDVSFTTAQVYCFTNYPRKVHMDQVLQIFELLNKYKYWSIVIDSRDTIVKGIQES